MKKIGSEHTPTTRTFGEISKQNRATHSDEEENTINIFRRSNSTISCKLLSFDAGVNEISIKNKSLKGGNPFKNVGSLVRTGARLLTRAKKPCHRGKQSLNSRLPFSAAQ